MINSDTHQLPQTIDLLLSVPAGLEDVAVQQLPSELIDIANHISYRIGSGYLSVCIHASNSSDESDTQDYATKSSDIADDTRHRADVTKTLADLVQRPPLSIIAAYVSMGEIVVPRTIFEAPKNLLSYAMRGFQLQPQRQQQPHVDGLDNTIQGDTGRIICKGGPGPDLGLKWQDALSVLAIAPTPLAQRLVSMKDNAHDNVVSGSPLSFRASFDRGDLQHKGVRSQDLAAALGGLTGDVFPSWKVDLTGYDVEVFGRWIQEDSEEVHFKSRYDANVVHSNKHLRTENDVTQHAHDLQQDVRMQVGMTLPLALSSCPYRYRPVDGRTSLKIEIAYNLLALAAPRPGNVVLDICSGVGTIPIVGAAHYPASFFAGFEIVPHNVEKADQNATEMIAKAEQEFKARASSWGQKAKGILARPSLFLGDARAVCWRSGTVDLIISDLPWGQRENSHLYNCKLYPRLVKEVIRLLKVNGRAVLVTGERKLLQRQLDAPFAKPHLRVLQKREITIGFKVMVFELQRI